MAPRTLGVEGELAMCHAHDHLEKDCEGRQANRSENDAPRGGDIALRLLALEEPATVPARGDAKKRKDGTKNGKCNRNRDRQKAGKKSELRDPLAAPRTMRRRGAHVLAPCRRVGIAVPSMPGRPSCSTWGAATLLPFDNRGGTGGAARRRGCCQSLPAPFVESPERVACALPLYPSAPRGAVAALHAARARCVIAPRTAAGA